MSVHWNALYEILTLTSLNNFLKDEKDVFFAFSSLMSFERLRKHVTSADVS